MALPSASWARLIAKDRCILYKMPFIGGVFIRVFKRLCCKTASFEYPFLWACAVVIDASGGVFASVIGGCYKPGPKLYMRQELKARTKSLVLSRSGLWLYMRQGRCPRRQWAKHYKCGAQLGMHPERRTEYCYPVRTPFFLIFFALWR